MPATKPRATHTAGTAHRAHESSKKIKLVKVKHHHGKPYRKRHYAALSIFILLGLFLLVFSLQYRSRVSDSVRSAQDFVASLFSHDSVNSQEVASTFGFRFQYDPHKYYASAVDANTGDLFIGDELATRRAYEIVRLSQISLNTRDVPGSLTIQYHDNLPLGTAPRLDQIETSTIATVGGVPGKSIEKVGASSVTIAGKPFIRTEWRYITTGVVSKLNPGFITYTGVANNRPLTAKLVLGSGQKNTRDFEQIIGSISLEPRTQAKIQSTPQLAEKHSANRSLFDSIFFNSVAQAAGTQAAPSTAERISSTYGPAAVKIFNAYCMDITLDGKPYIHDACSAASGSGFFISADGYVATNGHVATSNIKDIVIYDAIVNALGGQTQYMDRLAQLAGFSDADVPTTSEKDAVDFVVSKFYSISDSHFAATNNVSNMLVSLNQKQPATKELVKLTGERKEYAEQDSIKRAKLIAADYRMLDGIKTFKNSDVAIIKINGNNYPVGKLGSMDGLEQGANIFILGFPGIASENGLVDATQSTVTLTSGQVSSVKNNTGSNKKLIETTTTIGHGNSGGPVFKDSGEIIGIATYTVDGSGGGDGTFNYIRDIKDLKDLIDKQSFTLNTNSSTQTEWEKGLDLFYKAHYSKALKDFDKVKSLYPNHPKVADFIANAQQNIKDGKDVKDLPIVLMGIGAAVILLGAGVFVVLIIRHKKAHQAYSHHIATGAMQPMTPEMPAQYVSVPPAQVVAPAPISGFPPSADTPPPSPVPPQAAVPPAVITPKPQQPAPPNQQPPPPNSPVVG
jgi:S1-C subfamily serine protease